MQSSKTKKILKKYKYVFETLENYNRTRTLPFQRKRIDVTLSIETLMKNPALKGEVSSK